MFRKYYPSSRDWFTLEVHSLFPFMDNTLSGTNLGCLQTTKDLQTLGGLVSDIKFFLLFTDGISTLGVERPPLHEAPIFIINTSPVSNARMKVMQKDIHSN